MYTCCIQNWVSQARLPTASALGISHRQPPFSPLQPPFQPAQEWHEQVMLVNSSALRISNLTICQQKTDGEPEHYGAIHAHAR